MWRERGGGRGVGAEEQEMMEVGEEQEVLEEVVRSRRSEVGEE